MARQWRVTPLEKKRVARSYRAGLALAYADFCFGLGRASGLPNVNGI